MSAFKFEVHLNDSFLFEVSSPQELVNVDELVDNYLEEHPEIQTDIKMIKINVRKEPCNGCGKTTR